MSDGFGKKQLLKFGWFEGKGLGRDENGITEPIKPKLKFDKSGVGHSEKDIEWWDAKYNEAARNLVLNNEADQVSLSAAKENAFNLPVTKEGFLNAIQRQKLEYEKFLKTSVLENGHLSSTSEVETTGDSATNNLPVFQKLSDKELLKVCEGRTAHKGARHGLKLSGKLARIAEQEKQYHTAMKRNNSSKESKEDSNEASTERNITRKDLKVEGSSMVYKIDPISEADKAMEDKSIEHAEEPVQQKYPTSKATARKARRRLENLIDQLNQNLKVNDDLQKSNTQESNELPPELLHFLSECKICRKKCRKHRLAKTCTDPACVNSEVYRKNLKIKKKKKKRHEKKEQKKLDELSKSLLAFSLDKEQGLVQHTTEKKIKKKKDKSREKKDKSREKKDKKSESHLEKLKTKMK